MTACRLDLITTVEDHHASYPVMRELRPHLTDVDSFVAQVRRQATHGYRLLAAWHDDQIKALAGYRVQENMLYGRFMYVDDLVTTADARSRGLGAQLIGALHKEARDQGCAYFVLDTGLSNALGQRFYYRQGLLAVGMHFRQAIQESLPIQFPNTGAV